MIEKEPRGHRVDVSGPISRGQITVGDNNVVINVEKDPTVDVHALTDFARATRQALPTLELGPQQENARRITEELLAMSEAPQPDHRRLRALGESLRSMLENGIGGVLTTALLNLWTP